MADLSSVYSGKFVSAINDESALLGLTSDYANEIFLYFFIPLKERLEYLSMNPARTVALRYTGPTDFILWVAARSKSGSSWVILSPLSAFLSAIVWLLILLLTPVLSVMLAAYLLIRFRFDDAYSEPDRLFGVVRSAAAMSKLNFLRDEGVVFFVDDFGIRSKGDTSIYAASIAVRIKALVVSPIYAVRDTFLLARDAVQCVGFAYSGIVFAYFFKRIPHKANFEFYLLSCVRTKSPEYYYTGNKEDRFACIETKITNFRGVQSLCYPHGLEYAYRMPSGLVGDVFYCNSPASRDCCESLYSIKDKFKYDEIVSSRMLGLSTVAPANSFSNIVFFPESREHQINRKIIGELVGSGLKFSVKLHPLDSLKNYEPYLDESHLITDFREAISNSVCLARKSTVLLEALYNSSVSIAVLFDPKDRKVFDFVFPALWDERIYRAVSVDELLNILTEIGFDDF